MNPFKENEEVLGISAAFYNKYYDDRNRRRLILGINPGRLGAGATGIPFTDSKRLKEKCGIDIHSVRSHEPSSVFIYRVIESCGGPEQFYSRFYINSVCPVGFLQKNSKGNWVNCNYYDFPELYHGLKAYCIEQLRKQLDFGIDRSVVYMLGKKNAASFAPWNREHGLFEKLEVLPHPRYIAQYKAARMEYYIRQYKKTFSLE